ncbi:hypothetical protein KP509_17G077000 [Ceratopteris richardii]|uniref:Uncharacterized protein n=1 Tax=Ceratopteris richardii TaxID=49495 RepID=A0A8T2SXH2_CERRI|nr:hypothetical protein KP509_17G077000 [Ceratopteris richardii]KAH7373829.1 hypothetical protein KP509_17G077000 [Ceratopteris richardii]
MAAAPDPQETPAEEEIITYELSPEQEQTLNKTFLLLQKKGTKKKNELDERDVPLLICALGFNPSDTLIHDIIEKAKSRQSAKITHGFLDYPYFEEAFAEAFTLRRAEFDRHSEEEILAALQALTPSDQESLEPQYLRKLLMDTENGFSYEEVDNMTRTFKDKDTGLLWHDDIAEVLAHDGLPLIL